jgi:hypothetical protein
VLIMQGLQREYARRKYIAYNTYDSFLYVLIVNGLTEGSRVSAESKELSWMEYAIHG